MSTVLNILNNFGQEVVFKAKKNLDKHDTGKLEKSIGYTAKESKNSIEFSIEMEAYGNYVDKGVKGVTSSAKAPNSPFKFGTGSGKKGGLRQAIDAWVRRKRFQFRQPNGKFMSYESTALLVTRSIWNKGLETTNFMTNAFESAYKELPDKIIETYGLDVDKFLNSSLKNNSNV